MFGLGEHICAACPKAVGRSCCEVEGDLRLASLTSGDIARIEAATGRRAQFFVDHEVLTPMEQQKYERLRPANAGMVRDGVRRHLRARNGACVFHRTDQGCTLPVEARPLNCRLYPFEFNWLGKLDVHAVERCHAVEQSQDVSQLLRSLGTSRRKLWRLHLRLLEEGRDQTSATRSPR
jgi:Fe-S-cluster containining protein